MNGKNPFEVAAESYDPCDPASQPNPELVDYLKEPVDQWILEHGVVEEATYREAREVWSNLGDCLIPATPETEKLEHLQPEYIRLVNPATARNFAVKLKPMVFESASLAMLPLGFLESVESRQIIAGQMFGVPRDDALVPVLVLDMLPPDEHPDKAIESMHEFFHLLNDSFADDPTELEVVF